MHRHLIAGLCFLAASSANAEPVKLADAALKLAVTGRTVHLDTPLGITVPITYHGNGLMSGKAGVLSYILGADNDRGRWWVENGKLCQKWFKWLDAQPNCMQVQQEGQRIFWRRDDGVTGTATIVAGLSEGATAAPNGLGGPPQALERREASLNSAASEETRNAANARPASTASHRAQNRGLRAASLATSSPSPIKTAEITSSLTMIVHAADHDFPPIDNWCRKNQRRSRGPLVRTWAHSGGPTIACARTLGRRLRMFLSRTRARTGGSERRGALTTFLNGKWMSPQYARKREGIRKGGHAQVSRPGR